MLVFGRSSKRCKQSIHKIRVLSCVGHCKRSCTKEDRRGECPAQEFSSFGKTFFAATKLFECSPQNRHGLHTKIITQPPWFLAFKSLVPYACFGAPHRQLPHIAFQKSIQPALGLLGPCATCALVSCNIAPLPNFKRSPGPILNCGV